MDAFTLAKELHKAAKNKKWQEDPLPSNPQERYYKIIPVPSSYEASEKELGIAINLLGMAANYANLRSTEISFGTPVRPMEPLELKISTSSNFIANIFNDDKIHPPRKNGNLPPDYIEGGEYVPMGKALELIRQRDSRGWHRNDEAPFSESGLAVEVPSLCRQTRSSHGLNATFHILEASRRQLNEMLASPSGSMRTEPEEPVRYLLGGKVNYLAIPVERAQEILVDTIGLDPAAIGMAMPKASSLAR